MVTNVPDDLKFAETHEWIRVDGDVGTVGISDHAQAELTDIVFAGNARKSAARSSRKKHPAAVVESVKAASDIYSSRSRGDIVEANEGTSLRIPSLLNTEPYGSRDGSSRSGSQILPSSAACWTRRLIAPRSQK